MTDQIAVYAGNSYILQNVTSAPQNARESVSVIAHMVRINSNWGVSYIATSAVNAYISIAS